MIGKLFGRNRLTKCSVTLILSLLCIWAILKIFSTAFWASHLSLADHVFPLNIRDERQYFSRYVYRNNLNKSQPEETDTARASNAERANEHTYASYNEFVCEIFPSTGDVKVPRIIHQHWRGVHIAKQYLNNMNSWVQNHPDWKFMYWTDESARNFISDKYQELLPYYDAYLNPVRRGDVMRYIILYEYGGIFADLDLENVKPIDRILNKYSCILPQEVPEHAIFEQNVANVASNSFLACRPKHPFYKQILDNIRYFYGFTHDIDATGTRFITLVYEQYRDDTHALPDEDNGVYFAPYQYFSNTMDIKKRTKITDMCNNKYNSLTDLQKQACATIKEHGFERKQLPCVLTIPHWRSFTSSHATKDITFFMESLVKYPMVRDTHNPDEKQTIDDYLPFGHDFVPELFPTKGETRIPRIIHQKWIGTKIPEQFVQTMKTWTSHHPEWKYMYWTDQGARDFVAEKYPDLLPYYDGYREPMRRADIMRYAVMYEYGGVYADLDLENIKPVDPIVRKYACILPQEIPEHTVFGDNIEIMGINAFLACRPKHPYFKKLLDNVKYFYGLASIIDSTGPRFVTVMHQKYVEERRLPAEHKDGIYFAPYQYFFNTLDGGWRGHYSSCPYRFKTLTHLQRRACATIVKYGFDRDRLPCTFTVHQWVHTNMGITITKEQEILGFIPTAVIYGNNTSQF